MNSGKFRKFPEIRISWFFWENRVFWYFTLCAEEVVFRKRGFLGGGDSGQRGIWTSGEGGRILESPVQDRWGFLTGPVRFQDQYYGWGLTPTGTSGWTVGRRRLTVESGFDGVSEPPDGSGEILRTAGEGFSPTVLVRQFCLGWWKFRKQK